MRFTIQKSNIDMSNGQTIYHLLFKESGESHYFGSLAAIYETFKPDEIGVALTTLWGYGITRVHPYENRKCIIHKGELHRKRGNRASK